MKERPILFSGPMVRAILENRKTQTRRVVNPQPVYGLVQGLFHGWKFPKRGGGAWLYPNAEEQVLASCPYGKPGDLLWVREAWRVAAWREDQRVAVDYKASPELNRTPWCYPDEELFERLYMQSMDDCVAAKTPMDANGYYHWERGQSPCRWRPSIHMPRWASRITLEITDVRVELVQDISEQNAYAEGCDDSGHPYLSPFGGRAVKNNFAALWDSINETRGFGWDDNPWVWVLSFKRIDAAERAA